MPLTGHAIAGATTALLVSPAILRNQYISQQTVTQWIPFNAAIAYVPDIATELLFLAGWPDAKTCCHSFLFAGIAALICTFVFRSMFSSPPLRRFFFFLGGIALHDILDMLQSSDRLPLWPFSKLIISWPLIPEDPLYEGLLFLVLFTVFLIFFFHAQRVPLFQKTIPENHATKLRSSSLFITLFLVLVATAITTHQVRILREKQLYLARKYIAEKQYIRGLSLLRSAQRWPAKIHPGRVEYLQGYILAQTGKWKEAEEKYLLSWEKNHHYFWTIAELIILYAQQDIPLSKKLQLITPWYKRLITDFSRHSDLPEYREKLRMLLGKKAYESLLSAAD